MPYTAKQALIALSIIYLIFSTALACYGLYMIRKYSLPIPTSLGAFTVMLPAFAGFSLETTRAASRGRRQGNQKAVLSHASMIANFILTVYETVLVTLSGTHIAPVGELTCHLDQQWLKMFGIKDANAIRTIQDAFQCCGLRSSKDKSWPFEDRNNPQNTCQNRFGWDKSCLNDWRAYEQKIAGVLLVVPILVFVWKVIVISEPFRRPAWFNHIAPILSSNNDVERDSSRQAIEYRDVQEQLSDSSVAGEEPGEHVIPRAIEARRKDILNGTQRIASTRDVDISHNERNQWASQ